jgi:hypothetical protein
VKEIVLETYTISIRTLFLYAKKITDTFLTYNHKVMRKNLFLFACVLSFSALLYVQPLKAQNSSPYWSLAGNSNASAASKLGTVNSIPLHLITNDQIRIRIYENGRVGVGSRVTNLNATRVLNLADENAVMRILRVHSSFAPAVELISRTSADGANVAYWDFYAEPSDKSFRIRDRVMGGSGLDRVTVSNIGNVGIGTTTPTYKLQVGGNANISNGLLVSNGGISSYNSAGSGVYSNGSTYGVYADGGSYGLHGRSSGGWGVWGHSTSGIGVGGTSGSSYGVYGNSSTYPGVWGNSSSHYGVQAQSSSTYAAGAFGVSGIYAQGGTGYGVYGRSSSNYGGYFYSVSSYGLRAATGRADKNWAGVFDGNVYTFGVYQTSDKNLKKNIEDVSDALSIINQLKPRSYEFRNDGKITSMHLPRGKHYGFIAQDIEEVLPNLVNEVDAAIPDPANTKHLPLPTAAPLLDANAPAGHITQAETKQTGAQQSAEAEKLNIKSINYIELIPILTKGMQELSKENQDLRLEVAELKQMVTKLANGQHLSTFSGSNAMLQNVPNPAKGSTRILYNLPDDAQRSQLLITDALGRTIRIVQLTRSGVVNFDTSALSAGVYNYSLIADGKTIQTRQMTVEK